MKLTNIIAILLLIAACSPRNQEADQQDSHVTMPEKDKDGEKEKDKEDFGRLMEKLGGKDFVDNMKTSSEKLLNSNLEKEQENAIESGFVGSEKPILESFPHVLMGAPEAYEHMKNQLPALQVKLNKELNSKNSEEKEIILQNLLKDLEEAFPKDQPDRFDFRLVAWFMRSFTQTVNSEVVGKIYERILFQGDLITKEYIFENNFMEKHAYDLGPILDFYYTVFRDLTNPQYRKGKFTLAGEIGSQLKDAVERNIEVAENHLSQPEKEQRAQTRKEGYVKWLREKFEAKLKNHVVDVDFSAYFPILQELDTFNSSDVAVIYRLFFTHGNQASRVRLVNEYLDRPQASVSYLADGKVCEIMQNLLKLHSGLRSENAEENEALLKKLQTLSERFKAEDQVKTRERFIALEGKTPEEFIAEEKKLNKKVLDILRWNPEEVTPDEAIENMDGNKEHPFPLNIDFSHQVKKFLTEMQLSSEKEKQEFFEKVVFRGEKSTLDAIVKPLFGFSISDVEASLEEIKEFVRGKKLPEALAEIRNIKPKKSSDLTIAGEGSFKSFYKKVYFASAKSDFNYLNILKELISNKEQLRSPQNAQMVWELVFESVKQGKEQEARFVAEKLNLTKVDSFSVMVAVSDMEYVELSSRFLK